MGAIVACYASLAPFFIMVGVLNFGLAAAAPAGPAPTALQPVQIDYHYLCMYTKHNSMILQGQVLAYLVYAV